LSIKDAAAHNANFGPDAATGVDACVIHANPDKINDIGNNNDNIIHMLGTFTPTSTQHKT
jgi:hypothetical protein